MFRNDKAKLIEMLPNLRVLARSSPNDKYVLVGMLQDEHGEVVGKIGLSGATPPPKRRG